MLRSVTEPIEFAGRTITQQSLYIGLFVIGKSYTTRRATIAFVHVRLTSRPSPPIHRIPRFYVLLAGRLVCDPHPWACVFNGAGCRVGICGDGGCVVAGDRKREWNWEEGRSLQGYVACRSCHNGNEEQDHIDASQNSDHLGFVLPTTSHRHAIQSNHVMQKISAPFPLSSIFARYHSSSLFVAGSRLLETFRTKEPWPYNGGVQVGLGSCKCRSVFQISL